MNEFKSPPELFNAFLRWLGIIYNREKDLKNSNQSVIFITKQYIERNTSLNFLEVDLMLRTFLDLGYIEKVYYDNSSVEKFVLTPKGKQLIFQSLRSPKARKSDSSLDPKYFLPVKEYIREYIIRSTEAIKNPSNISEEGLNKRYRKFKSLVNMNAKEMITWKRDKCSHAASIKREEVINRVTRLLKKPKDSWTYKDYVDSGKVISYLSRAIAIKDSVKPANKECRRGKNYYALKNWAFDRDKRK